LTGLFDGHFRLLYDIEEARPDYVNDAQWNVAMRGLRTFLATGRADDALRLGWTKNELFRVPPLWTRVDLCGVALLIGDREVVEVTPAEVGIKTASGATQRFFRRPEQTLLLFTVSASSFSASMLAAKKFDCARLNTQFGSAATIVTAISKLQGQRCCLPSSALHHLQKPRLDAHCRLPC
jgi:hypothetical protein